jgi:Protein of unknown function (DUF2442)
MTGLTPDITDVTVLGHGGLHLTFADGSEGDVYVLDRMRGPVFENARTESGTIVWPGGADLAPDTLDEHVTTGPWPDTV